MSEQKPLLASRKRTLRQADEEELERWAKLSVHEAFAEVEALRQLVFKEAYQTTPDWTVSKLSKLTDCRSL